MLVLISGVARKLKSASVGEGKKTVARLSLGGATTALSARPLHSRRMVPPATEVAVTVIIILVLVVLVVLLMPLGSMCCLANPYQLRS